MLSSGYPTREHLVMRIGTYNVLGLKGYPPVEAAKELGDPDSEKTAAHFQKVFEELSCDILALQEGVSLHQIQRIALSMGLNAATFPSPIHWPGHVLTRYPILESRAFSHTAPESEERPFSRTAGAALLQIDEKTRMWVFVVHLHPGIVELRDWEAELVKHRVAELSSITEHIMVLGDFNCEVHERIHGHLKKMGFANAMETVGGGIRRTMDTVGIQPHFIDHIYVSPSLISCLTKAEIVRGKGFRHDGPQREGLWVHSDHLPVLAELTLP